MKYWDIKFMLFYRFIPVIFKLERMFIKNNNFTLPLSLEYLTTLRIIRFSACNYDCCLLLGDNLARV